MRSPVIVIVDGYSSGNLLAPAFRAAEAEAVLIHVSSVPVVGEYERQFRSADFDHCLQLHPIGDVELVVEEIRRRAGRNDIVAVIPGAECGVG